MLKITSRTRVIAVLGYPLEYSLTAQLLNAGFDAARLDFTCVPFEVKPARLEDAVKAMRTLGMAGANVAMPFKEAVLPLLDRLGPTATLVGLADTVGLEQGKLVGHNSDYHAFLNSYREAVGAGPRGKQALVLGAGGTAGAIAAALLKEGAAGVRLANRTPDRSEALAARLRAQIPGTPLTLVPWERGPVIAALRDCDLLVKAVPGDPQTGRGPLLSERDLHPALTVFDAGYVPTTMLLMAARRAGATAVSGTTMMLEHALMSFRLWTQVEPPRPAMETALASLLGVSAATPVSMS